MAILSLDPDFIAIAKCSNVYVTTIHSKVIDDIDIDRHDLQIEPR